jgi:hypothetical protein
MMKVGDRITVEYPFVRVKVDMYGETTMSWRPGVGHRYCAPDDTEAYANGVGSMELTIISIHKPGRFPTRVFFTRKFIAPDGYVFGKTKLRIMTIGAFRARARSFMHPYVVDENEREAA